MIVTEHKQFIDSNIWIYALTNTPKDDIRHDRAVLLLEDTEHIVISTQVVNEVFSNLRRKFSVTDGRLKALLADWMADYTLVSLTPEQINLACDLRNGYKLSYWDSLMIASALDAGCRTVYSEDMQHGLVIENCLTIINPFTLLANNQVS